MRRSAEAQRLMAIDRSSSWTEPGERDRPAVDATATATSVLVTGAGGFVGGHIARELAQAGYRVKALTRRAIARGAAGTHPHPHLEWVRGDLCNRDDLHETVRDIQAVVHAAGWVSLKPDRRGISRRVNVEATRDLLDRCAAVGVEKFVYTSSLWTTAAGTADDPADEARAWNLESIQSPYCATKREAERLVLERNRPGFQTAVICPGMVMGPGDHHPTSTELLLTMARWPVVFLPAGGIPVVDARVLALAHRKVLEAETGGRRYVVAGPYLSYHEIAGWVRRFTGRPRWVVAIPDRLAPALCRMAGAANWVLGDLFGEKISPAAVAGGFLRLHVSGARADAEFGLDHPPASQSIFEALDDHRTSGRAPWLRVQR